MFITLTIGTLEYDHMFNCPVLWLLKKSKPKCNGINVIYNVCLIDFRLKDIFLIILVP